MVVSREKNVIRDRLYNHKNREKVNKRKRERYQRDKEEISRQHKIYKDKNRHKVKAQNYAMRYGFKKDKCEGCSSKDKLNFHHIDYENYKNPKCGMTLCIDCHKKDHRTVIVSNES